MASDVRPVRMRRRCGTFVRGTRGSGGGGIIDFGVFVDPKTLAKGGVFLGGVFSVVLLAAGLVAGPALILSGDVALATLGAVAVAADAAIVGYVMHRRSLRREHERQLMELRAQAAARRLRRRQMTPREKTATAGRAAARGVAAAEHGAVRAARAGWKGLRAIPQRAHTRNEKRRVRDEETVRQWAAGKRR